MYKIGYEQTDRKVIVDIYGIEFEVKKIGKNLLEEIEKIKNDNLEDEELYKYVDLFLGEGASIKINDKRKQDGYAEMDYQVILAILDTIITAYNNVYRDIMNYKNKFNKYNRRRRY